MRELQEETGVRARLGPWLRDVRYAVADGRKFVRFWSAEALTPADFTPNHEVDELRWVPPDTAADLLSYDHDRDVLARFVELGPPTSVLLVVRHAKAGSRDKWDGADHLRPLSNAGRKQAQAIAELLPSYGPDRIGSAPQVRCRDTVAPLADALGLPIADERAAQRGQLPGRSGRHAEAGAGAGGPARGHRGVQPGRRDPGR